ncbi:unnamed protein product [Cylicocyclus nassatus]|uniref:Uncharacterized protein n=1 Tax=Cylicocyclus nassatus TaxID=53992 RepID=A0AA36GWV0_CYLNA|nr:unnamed protein product [Cylicocyclus nassatus]
MLKSAFNSIARDFPHLEQIFTTFYTSYQLCSILVTYSLFCCNHQSEADFRSRLYLVSALLNTRDIHPSLATTTFPRKKR